MKHRAVQAVKNLYRSLLRKYHKVYMRDLETVFQKLEKLDLSPQEIQALEYLRNDIERD